jgi:hypothetical protein
MRRWEQRLHKLEVVLARGTNDLSEAVPLLAELLAKQQGAATFERNAKGESLRDVLQTRTYLGGCVRAFVDLTPIKSADKRWN